MSLQAEVSPSLSSIMARPGPGRDMSPLRSLSFHAPTTAPDPAHLAPISPIAPSTPSGILLNRLKLDHPSPDLEHVAPATHAPAPPHDAAPSSSSPAVGLGLAAGVLAGGSVAGGLARVGSPDGSASDASAGSEGWSASSSSTAPSSAVASPSVHATVFGGISQRSQSPSESIATLTLLPTPSSPVFGHDSTPRVSSRSPSPHCKFAPLPLIADDARPMTRRNSTVLQATGPRRSLGAGEGDEAAFALELSDSLVAPSPIHPTNASLGLIAGASALGGPGFRSRRSSGSAASGRSASPSPSRRSSSTHSRPHSPPLLSRHGSTDALHLHYIDVAGPRSPNPSSSREREGVESLSRAASLHRSEASAPASGRASLAPSSLVAGLGIEAGALASIASPPVASALAATARAPPASTAIAPFAAQDAAAPPAVAAAPTARRTVFAEPPPVERAPIVGRCRSPTTRLRSRSIEGGVEQDVFEVEATSGEDEALDEEEEEEEEEEDSDEDEPEDEDDEREDAEENAEEADEPEDLAAEQERKTARGAAVEVVHWTRTSA